MLEATTSIRPSARWKSVRAAVLSALVCGLLAAIPTAPANAASRSVSGLEASQVETLLDSVPISSLGAVQLTEVLGGLPQLGGIEVGKLNQALTSLLTALTGKSANIGELLGSPTAINELVAKLEEVLPLSGLLGTLLGGNPAAKIKEALTSLTSGELLGKVLGHAPGPEQTIKQVLDTADPSDLEHLLGSTLTGEAFSKETVTDLANSIGSTAGKVAEDVGKTPAELPGTAMALTAPLTNGEALSVLNGLGGVSFSLLGSGGKAGGGGEGGSGGGEGGNAGAGGSGGNAGAGAGGNGAGGTSVTINTPGSGSGGSPTTGVAASKPGKIKIIAHRVRNGVVSVEVATPGAGTVTLSGKGIRTLRKETAKAVHVWVRTKMTKAEASSIKRHPHKKTKHTVTVKFAQVGGPSSSATAKVIFG
jgi:hypothetical protein